MMHSTLYTKQKTRGFTLMEMLLVIAIIGILSSITLANLGGARGKARDSERVTEVGQIALALSLYYNACRAYPNAPLASNLTTVNANCPGVTLGNFINPVPKDPQGADYTYAKSASSFVIRATLEKNDAALSNDLDGTPEGVQCDDTAPNYYYCKGS